MIGIKKLFEMGIKPAWLTAKGRDTEYALWKRVYPYVDLSFKFRNEEGYSYLRLFFQNEELKEKFVQEGIREQGENKESLPYHEDVMGYFLGFPPTAVQDYAEGIPSENRAFMNYHGLQFVVHENNVKKAISELRKLMPIPLKEKFKHRSVATAKFRSGEQLKFF